MYDSFAPPRCGHCRRRSVSSLPATGQSQRCNYKTIKSIHVPYRYWSFCAYKKREEAQHWTRFPTCVGTNRYRAERAESHHLRASASVSGGSKYLQRDRKAAVKGFGRVSGQGQSDKISIFTF